MLNQNQAQAHEGGSGEGSELLQRIARMGRDTLRQEAIAQYHHNAQLTADNILLQNKLDEILATLKLSDGPETQKEAESPTPCQWSTRPLDQDLSLEAVRDEIRTQLHELSSQQEQLMQYVNAVQAETFGLQPQPEPLPEVEQNSGLYEFSERDGQHTGRQSHPFPVLTALPSDMKWDSPLPSVEAEKAGALMRRSRQSSIASAPHILGDHEETKSTEDFPVENTAVETMPVGTLRFDPITVTPCKTVSPKRHWLARLATLPRVFKKLSKRISKILAFGLSSMVLALGFALYPSASDGELRASSVQEIKSRVQQVFPQEVLVESAEPAEPLLITKARKSPNKRKRLNRARRAKKRRARR